MKENWKNLRKERAELEQGLESADESMKLTKDKELEFRNKTSKLIEKEYKLEQKKVELHEKLSKIKKKVIWNKKDQGRVGRGSVNIVL